MTFLVLLLLLFETLPVAFGSCTQGYYQDSSNSPCTPLKSYGESCVNNQECNPKQLFSCINSTCLCNPELSVYNSVSFTQTNVYFSPVTTTIDPIYEDDDNTLIQKYRMNSQPAIIPSTWDVPSGVCVLKVGASGCSLELDSLAFCVRNSLCKDGACECVPPFTKNEDSSSCALGHGEICTNRDNNIMCHENLVCSGKIHTDLYSNKFTVSSRCQCPNPKYQEYDQVAKICRNLIDLLPCNPNDPLSFCTLGSSCFKDSNQSDIYHCKCEKGFIQSRSTNRCQLSYGQPCNYKTSMVAPLSHETCDSSLECINGICHCSNSVEIYDLSLRRCLSKIGYFCNENSDCETNSTCLKKMEAGQPARGRCISSKNNNRNYLFIEFYSYFLICF